MGLITNAPRGTLDKLPGEIHKYQHIERTAVDTAVLYGYREIRTPVFEHTELFKRGVGDTTDVVQKEMYTFEDKKGRSLTLKPEGTACVARAVIESGLINDALPLKTCYITNCYRYEAPQSGRYREFSQFGAEVYGANTPTCDVELIALAYDLFTKLGIPADSYSIEVNSIGCPDCRAAYQQKLREYYEQFRDKLCKDCLERLERNPMRLLDCKVPTCGGLKGNAPLILDYNCDSCNEFFNKFTDRLNSLDIPYTVNSRIVRGLDYYTNTVFEFVHRKTGLVFGAGGRYNGLIKQLGGAPTPASGFALGLERIASIIEPENLPTPKTPDIYIGGLGEAASDFALKLAQNLRSQGLWAEVDIVGRSVKAQLRYADKIGAKYSTVIGENELSNSRTALKNMQSGESVEIALDSDSFIHVILKTSNT
jgi:histidyl-tRNA synthetase